MATIHPNLKLAGEFTSCEDATAKINKNFKTLDDVVLKGVEGIVSTLPGSPVEGQAVILDTDNSLNVYSGGVWTSYAPNVGWNFIDVTDYGMLIFDGTQWLDIPLPNDYTNFITDAGNIGNGEGIFYQVNGTIAEFRTIVGINGIDVQPSLSGDEIEISNGGVLGANNIGSGEGIFAGLDLNQNVEFKSLTVGPGLAINSGPTEINISLAGQSLPLNWYPDPNSLDPNEPISVTGGPVASLNDDVFYNTKKMYDHPWSAAGGPFSGQVSEVHFEADIPTTLFDLEEDPFFRGYVDLSYDWSNFVPSGGFVPVMTITFEQLDSSNNVLFTQNLNDAVYDGLYRTRFDNVSGNNGAVRFYFSPYPGATKVRVKLKSEEQLT